jgi:membrane protein YdbS with pleckstrin-like domain
MDVDQEKQMIPLAPGQLSVLRVSAGAAASILLVGVVVADLVWRPIDAVPPGLATGLAALLLLAAVILLPARRYRSWGYRMDEDELHIRSGLWLRMHTIVPFGRVQHIDVAQGPIERKFAVGTLILHTAGTRNSAVPLPGLAFEEAGRIRDVIRSKIRQDLI